jgi:uncharacterized protein (DUF934 family)
VSGNVRAVGRVETDPVSALLPEGVSHLLIADDALIPSRWGAHVTLCGEEAAVSCSTVSTFVWSV